jgi:pyruvate/2-oxoglutarate dehydrogenase complex dihydrolipoamide acyltransferase (E2) component
MTEIRLPKIGTTMLEGTVERWLKTEGERVSEGDDLVEVTTDKVNAILPAPVSGILAKILVGPNQTVAVGSVLGNIDNTSALGD